jgi:hypothetical protein
MKNNRMNISRTGILALTAALVLSSCADWVEPKSIDLNVPTLESQNPELYAAYIKNLNDYKASDHKVLLVTFDNPTQAPGTQASHLTALPDSIDYVSLNNPDNLIPFMTEDMAGVRKKGTKVIYDVNFPAISRDWDLLSRDDATLTEADALNYIEQRTSEALSLCDKWGYDGLTFTYLGQSPGGLPVADYAVYVARQTKFFDLVAAWRQTHGGKSFSFIGCPQNLVRDDADVDNVSILAHCDYIILSTEAATSEEELTTTALWAVASGAPDDRFVFCQYMYDLDDADKANGYFNTRDGKNEKLPSIPITAAWMNKPSPDFVRRGMMIFGVQLDYYQYTPNWKITRETIATMNP